MKTAGAQQSWMTAITFAEAGEWDAARKFMPASMPPKRSTKRSTSWLERAFMAVAFAEAGLHDEALALADERKQQPRRRSHFLDSVGLGGIRVTYGIMPA